MVWFLMSFFNVNMYNFRQLLSTNKSFPSVKFKILFCTEFMFLIYQFSLTLDWNWNIFSIHLKLCIVALLIQTLGWFYLNQKWKPSWRWFHFKEQRWIEMEANWCLQEDKMKNYIVVRAGESWDVDWGNLAEAPSITKFIKTFWSLLQL